MNLDPRVPRGIQEIPADIVSETKKDVPIDRIDQLPHPLDSRIPTALQDLEEPHEQSYLQNAKETITGAYETAKGKASDIMQSGQNVGQYAKNKAEAVFDRDAVKIGEMEKAQHPQDLGVPNALQGTDQHTSIQPEKSYLETAKDNIIGTYESVKEKAADLMGIHHEKTAGEKLQDFGQDAKQKYEQASEKMDEYKEGAKEAYYEGKEKVEQLGNATKERFDEMNESSREYIRLTGGKMKDAGDYLQDKAHDKGACKDASAAIKKYAEISADKVDDMCEASKDYIGSAGDKMKSAGEYLQKQT